MKTFALIAGALAATLLLASCGGGGGKTGMTPTTPPPGNMSVTPATPVSVLGHSIRVIHLERTDQHSTLRNLPVLIPVKGTNLELDGTGPLRRNITCPGVPPRGNECTLTHYTLDAAGGKRYAARKHESVNLDKSISFVVRDELNNLRRARDVHGVRMYETDVTGVGIEAATQSYGGFGQWMAFHASGPTPDVASGVLRDGGIFTIGAVAFGNLYTDPSGDSRPKGSANYQGAMVGREHGWLGGKAVQGKSDIAYDFSTATVDPDRRAGFLAARFRPSAGPSGHAGSSIWAAGESLTRQRSGAGGLFVMVGSSPARWARATPSGAVPGPPCRVELSRRGQPGADAGGGMARWIRRRAARRWAPAPPSTRVTRRP